eukprot:CAMPEP_0175915430 /NCGR_PEP_ID=MMETSP0108-20121206/10312_1 /TAXON_ID=195067 ORGANISM="Goniomonas pacifica, Strain CCMP1869" /NCGR_SAMPLE_ID=MMETSP0108 /ASSEMBLY_ACC=CAM_ASM_000204 /LENGTH=48 /DNA_ID= /DNA_START= /DNA_END= /DNA_ORIENTATION=
MTHGIICDAVQRDIGPIIILDVGIIGDRVIADQQGPAPLIGRVSVRPM